MQFITFILSIFTLISAATAGVIDERDIIRKCGTQPYYVSKYTCYPNNNNLLCPIINGVVYLPCGRACYDPSNYKCSNGQLSLVGTCNGQVYDKNSYVCVNNFLCPVTYPLVCGIACYKSSEYYCKNGVLFQV